MPDRSWCEIALGVREQELEVETLDAECRFGSFSGGGVLLADSERLAD